MKVRIGFVSNSSSSSFVIAYNGGKKDLKEKLNKIFGKFPENFPIKSMPNFGDSFYNNISEEFKNKKDYFGEMYIDEDDLSEDDEEVIKYFDKGWKIYVGGFSDQSDSIDEFLCDCDIDFKDDEIYILQNGGY